MEKIENKDEIIYSWWLLETVIFDKEFMKDFGEIFELKLKESFDYFGGYLSEKFGEDFYNK